MERQCRPNQQTSRIARLMPLGPDYDSVKGLCAHLSAVEIGHADQKTVVPCSTHLPQNHHQQQSLPSRPESVSAETLMSHAATRHD